MQHGAPKKSHARDKSNLIVDGSIGFLIGSAIMLAQCAPEETSSATYQSDNSGRHAAEDSRPRHMR